MLASENMKLLDIKVETSDFNILNVQEDIFDLTTATQYNTSFHPVDGGITIVPEFENNKYLNGELLIRQFCVSHEFNVTTELGLVPFKLDEICKDTYLSMDLNYQKFQIRQGDIVSDFCDELRPARFFDSLQRTLYNHWVNLEYKIVFNTFYILNVENKLTPIFSFIWNAEAICSQINGKWNLISNRISTEEEIRNSLKFDNFELPFNENFNHLRTVIQNHFNLKQLV